MEQKEQKLIEDLFYKLAESEKNDLNRDIEADHLIKNLLNKQPHSAYYMAQIILIQETAIKTLNKKINELENKKNKSSFLSGLFGSNQSRQKYKNPSTDSINYDAQNNNRSIPTATTHIPSFNNPTNPANNAQSNTGNNVGNFLSGALQTATGVAGGMVMANMLTHLFEHKNVEEEVLNNSNNSHLDPDIIVEREIHDHYIHEDNQQHSALNNTHHNNDDYPEDQQDIDDNTLDINDDDNFI